MDTKKLRQKILDLAIHGKLVPNEGPWEEKTLGEVCDYGKCSSVSVEELSTKSWVLELEDLEKDTGRIIKRLSKGEREIKGVRHSFKKGNVLYSKLRTYLNKVLVAPEDGYCTTEIIPITTNATILPEYLNIVMRSPYFLEYTAQCGYGVKMPRLSTSDAKKAIIPLPPLSEQKRIVAEVEKWFALIDVIENSQQDLNTAIDQAKNKILDLAIHGKLVPNEGPWEEKTLGEVCKKFIVPQRDKPTSFEGNIPWCRIEDIEGKFLNGSKSNQNVTKELADSMNMHLCPIGTVICSCSASIGFQAITTVECYTNQTFIGIVANDSLFNEYLYYFLMSQKNRLLELGTGSTIKYISREKFQRLTIPLPPLSEQKRIVEKIEQLFAALDAMKM